MTTLGFVGLGRMGEPMAGRLVEQGTDLVVWNRSPEPAERLAALGARRAGSVAEVFALCDTVVLMLAHARAVDQVLDDPRIPLEGRTVVAMGTVAPDDSRALCGRLRSAGASYCEAPVSGSRVPAETGTLVAMLAGEERTLDRVEPLLAPLTSAVFRCGDVPRALETKLAVNAFLIGLVTALAESVALAERLGVDATLLRSILDAGPMSSAVSRGKLAKLADGDRSAQAALSDVLYNSRLILDAAGLRGMHLPLTSVCTGLLEQAQAAGLGSTDMISVLDVIRPA